MDGPTDLDALAEALRVDGVVVDRVMGSGEAQESHDRIAALVREVPFPVYVALVESPAGLPEDRIGASESFAGLLGRRLGDGLYVVATPDAIAGVYSFGLDSDPAQLSLGAYANRDALDEAVAEVTGAASGEDHLSTPPVVQAEAQVRTAVELVELGRGPSLPDAVYPATLTDADAEDLAERAVRLQADAEWRPEGEDYVEVRTASAGLSTLVGGLTALVLGLVLGQTLRGWPRRRVVSARDAASEDALAAGPPDLETERERARELADILTTSLQEVDWERVKDRDVAGRALTARDAVEPLLASDDVADVIGAQVVARAGSRDLRRGRRGTGDPWVSCFFDPRHPEADSSAHWRLGDGYVEVPCCVPCATAVRHDGTPAHLRLSAGRGTEPYWERDDVWARTGFGATTDFLARDVLTDRAGER